MKKTFVHKNVSLAYFDNEQPGTPFVFQHGLTGDSGQILDSYPASSRRLIVLECRGHGDSQLGPEEELGIDVFADDLIALLDHLGLDKIALGGLSMGAAVCANLAAKQPERIRSLILHRPAWLDKSCPDNMAIFGVIANYLQLYGKAEGKTRFLESGVYETLKAASPDNALSLSGIFARPSPGATAALLKRIVTCRPGLDAAALSSMPVPKLVLGNAHDAVHPLELARKLAHLIGKAEFRELYPKSLNKNKHAAELRQAIDAFLDAG